jgi:hypothetical protein
MEFLAQALIVLNLGKESLQISDRHGK